MTIFAAPGDEFVLPLLIGVFTGIVIAFLLGCLINAVWLCLACAWVGLGRISMGKALSATFMGNFVLAAFGLSTAVSMWYLTRIEERMDRDLFRNLLYFFDPQTFIYFTFGSVLVHGTIFSHLIKEKDDRSLPFSKACLLASVYLALCCLPPLLLGWVGLLFIAAAN